MVIPLRDENPTSRTALFTLLLIGANVLVFLFVQPGTLEGPDVSGTTQTEFLYEHAMVPCEVRGMEGMSEPEIVRGACLTDDERAAVGLEPVFPDKSVLFSVFASMFMHGGLLHIGGNMLFLWVFGNNVEDRLGPAFFVPFYLVTGIAAAVAHFLTDPSSTIPVIGASGAVAGVMGAYLVWWPQARILSILPIFFFISFVHIRAVWVLGIWFVMQFFTNPNSGVAWAAHVGGFVAGALIALVMGRPRRPAPAQWYEQ